MALPEWMKERFDPDGYDPAAPPTPSNVRQVPDVMVNVPYGACHSEEYETSYAKGWNDCRKEMLAAAPPAPSEEVE